jgi:glycosyltransferase involved in cell wall biosynthesis
MRVLQLTDDFAHAGGIQSAVRNTMDLLRQEGHEVRLFDPGDEGGAPLSRWLSARYLRLLRQDLARQPVDLVHAHSLSMRLSPLPLRAAVESGTPVVMTVHDFNYVCPRKWLIDPAGRPCARGMGAACLVLDCHSGKPGRRYLPYHGLRWLKVQLHRALLRRLVDVFVAPSELLASWLRRDLGVAPERIVHISNFVPVPPPPPPRSGTGQDVLFVGRLSPEKGVDCLLQAFRTLRGRFKEARLVVAGDGPARGPLEQLARRLGLEQAATFTGMLDHERLCERYAAARCCVFPSLWLENCPMGVLEAMAAGAAIVASRLGGIPEILRHEETGLLFERGDSAQLAAQLALILDDAALAARLGAAARAEAARRFSPQAHRTQLLGLYERCLAAGRRAGRS